MNMNCFLIKIALLMMAIISTTAANTIDGVGSTIPSSPKSSFTSSGATFLRPRGGYAFLKKKEATSTSPKNEIPKRNVNDNTSSNKHPLLSSESAIKAAITRANRLNNHESSA